MLWRLRTFPDFCDPCLPTQVAKPPAGPDWIHEIKHDGFRLLARRGAAGARLLTRNGYDWTERFPLIVEALNEAGSPVSGWHGAKPSRGDTGFGLMVTPTGQPRRPHEWCPGVTLQNLT